MSSTKIKLIGLLTLMGCVTAEAGNTYMYKTPDGATILTTRKIDKPGYELLKVTDLSASPTSTKTSSTNTTTRKIDKPGYERLIIEANGPFYEGPKIETRTLSNNSVSTNNVSTSTKTASVSTSNVAKYYNSADWREDVKKSFEYLKPGEQVQLLEVLPGLDSYNSYSEQGYAVIGQSIFRDWNLPKDSLIAQAKKVGATFVTFSKYSESSVTYSTTNDPKNLALIDPNNLAIIYNYEVLFYVKDNYFKNPNALGITIGNIPLEKRKVYQRNTGAYIANVVQGSKAYNANLLNEDVMIAINDNPILTGDDFLNIKEKELKKTKVLNLKILRLVNNELNELNIPVNF